MSTAMAALEAVGHRLITAGDNTSRQVLESDRELRGVRLVRTRGVLQSDSRDICFRVLQVPAQVDEAVKVLVGDSGEHLGDC